MVHLNSMNKVPTVSYRPEQGQCPVCQSVLKRHHILWRKHLTFPTGVKQVVSWAYCCPQADCPGSGETYRSLKAETLHLKYRRFSRELVVWVGYRRFWQHQTRREIHRGLTQDLPLNISEREVTNLLLDFLALLRAAQPAQIRRKLKGLQSLVIGLDGMQPEKGNDCLYLVRELQSGVTLRAENLTESSHDTLSERLLAPLLVLAEELHLTWRGVVSDAQESIRLAVAQSLPGVPHQACQAHCLRDAGQLTFAADRAMKTDLKAAFRQRLARLHKRLQTWPADDLCRPILLDYAEAIHSTLLEGGVAPFELGGIKVFEALDSLAASLTRCQKKATMSCCAGCWWSPNVVCFSPRRSNATGDSGSG